MTNEPEDALLIVSQMQREGLAQTGRDLDEALDEFKAAVAKRPRDVIGEIIATMNARADEAQERLIDALAAEMVSEPWRIAKAVYPTRLSIWPVEVIGACGLPVNLDPEDVLAECQDRIAGLRILGRANHWTYSHTRLVGLLAAERALEKLT